jgi:transcriptional regulator with XRE-family HTH domain
MSITAAQCKGARAMLDLAREDLAERAGVSKRTLIDFERGARQPQRSTIAAIRTALESAGVEFIEENGGGPGVRLRKQT